MIVIQKEQLTSLCQLCIVFLFFLHLYLLSSIFLHHHDVKICRLRLLFPKMLRQIYKTKCPLHLLFLRESLNLALDHRSLKRSVRFSMTACIKPLKPGWLMFAIASYFTFHSSFILIKVRILSPFLIPNQEELKRAQVAEREKRAAAAERRRAAAEALSAQGNSTATAPSTAQPKSGVAGEINCSCCNVSLAGKVPFHRYNYKYCSTSCMHVHREILEDG